MKYPIGVQDFKKLRNGGFAYVDKTEAIYKLVSNGTIYFLSRPRRFGKSLLVSTLKYYFLGEKELFEGLAIEKLEKDWIEYPVFHIDFNGSNFTEPGTLFKKINGAVKAWESIYGACPDVDDLGDRFAYVLQKAHEQTGRRAVVLIDEYDKPILDVLETGFTNIVAGKEITLEEEHRNILKGFYSVFKRADQDLQFVLLTGVTKFSQVSIFSGFNQPNDISMASDYEALCGITEEELYGSFAEPIREMAKRLDYTEEEIKQVLKDQYDGYHFSSNMTDVYNPFSLLNAFAKQRISDFWFATGSPSYLVRLLNHTKEDLDQLVGKYYDESQFIDYKADVEKPLPMIYQSGYLTIKKHNRRVNTYLLDFPNNEVKNGFVSIIASNYFRYDNPKSWIFQLVEAFDNADLEQVRKLFTAFLADIPYSVRRKSDERDCERDFQYTFYLILRMISCYFVFIEKQQSEGRVDCVIESPTDVFIFEFKLDGTADEALKQIDDKGYARSYEADTRAIHSIGAVFSSQIGTISDWKQN